MTERDDEERRLRSVALQNASSILAARRRAEEALEAKTAELDRSLSRLRATLEATTDAILVTDDEGRVTDFNSNYAKLWSVPAALMENRDHRKLLEFIAPQCRDPEAFKGRVDEIYRTSPPESFDVVELGDGRLIERFSRVQSANDPNGGRVWSFRDVTQRERAEREHAYSNAIIVSSNDAIVSKTLDGIITGWNAAAERIFGYPAAEAIGRPILMIIPPDRIDEEVRILERIRSGERVEHFETIRVRKDGTLLHVSLTISPVKDATGRIIGASKICRDVTERVHLLEREQAARARAEEASRLKDEFLATVSHELRTPLNAILGWAQMLRTGKLDSDRARHAIEVVERNARIQAQVIEDLLDVSAIITGKLRLNVRAMMPAGSVESALESVRPAAEAKSVRLHAVLDPHAGPISGDGGRLQQIVWNLLSNAIKFTPRGGRVEVRLERVQSHVEIVVSDNGPGISQEFLPYIFDRFRQADASSTRTTSGLGLGLAIVRHLVELHGGSVSASSPGKGLGSTFRVTLPLRPVQAQPEAEPTASAASSAAPVVEGGPSLGGVRILLVDDEADTRELLKQVLESYGADVRQAASAREALERLREWRPSVLVSDIGMPGEDGYALIRQVREWEKESGTRIPAVALTAYARSEDRMRALLAGYQVHVAKPIEPLEFALVVAGVVQPAPAPR